MRLSRRGDPGIYSKPRQEVVEQLVALTTTVFSTQGISTCFASKLKTYLDSQIGLSVTLREYQPVINDAEGKSTLRLGCYAAWDYITAQAKIMMQYFL